MLLPMCSFEEAFDIRQKLDILGSSSDFLIPGGRGMLLLRESVALEPMALRAQSPNPELRISSRASDIRSQRLRCQNSVLKISELGEGAGEREREREREREGAQAKEREMEKTRE